MNKKKTTVYTVAKHAGVSIATVARTLAGNRRVSPGTRQRVMQAIEDLNFEPNPSARRLAYMLQTSNGLTRHDVLDIRLIIRQSCGCPIRSDPNPK